MLSTAWPWPYAPQGMPELTIQMGRPDPFDPNDGCGDGRVQVYADGLIEMLRPVEPQPGHGEQGIYDELGETERTAAAQPAVLLTQKEIKHE